jgi:aminoglycoside phosphotransferase (APT) family kinase protein
MLGGLSHHVWHVETADGANLIVRVADGAAAPHLFARNAQAEWIALTALAQTGIAPRPIRRIGGAVVTEFISGRAWNGEFAAAGVMLRALHSQPAPDDLPHAPRCAVTVGQEILTQCRDQNLALIRPDPAPMSGPDLFLHGDPVSGNIVMQQDEARLIDWQCPARGPALNDIALFLSPAMQVIGRGRVASDIEISAFVQGYGPLPEGSLETGTMAPLHWCIACHCQWRIEQGHEAYRPALAAEITALARAVRHP